MAGDPLAALSLDHPLVLAPMAGGPATPELVAAVSNAGGLAFLGAAYLPSAQLRDALRRIRALTSRPFGVNLFAGGSASAPGDRPSAVPAALALVAPFHARLGLAPPALPELPADPFAAQLEVVLDERPAAFGVTFGVPPPDAMRALRARGILTFGTATCVREAERLAAAGVDAVVAQGAEAGGHRGTFAATLEEGLVPTLRLVEAIRRAVPLPVIAAGGLMDGRDVRAALDAGAAAAALGTAFLACPESGAPEPYKRALLAARSDETVLTRAFSGRWARGLRNELTEAGEAHPEAILPFPLQNELTRPLRQAAARRGYAGLLSLWAGQGVARIRSLPAGDLVRTLAEELRAAR